MSTARGNAEVPSPRSPLTFSGIEDLVTFIIGPLKRRVQLHKKFVCHHSPILEAAFSSGFLEGSTQTYELDNVTESTFALFCQWIYTQKMDSTSTVKLKSLDLVGLWVLADKFLIPRRQNRIMDLIDEIGRTGIVPAAIAYVYHNTPIDSPLRKVYVSQATWASRSSLFVEFASVRPKDFVLDVACACRTIMIKREIFGIDGQEGISRKITDYHVKEH
ncbi:hypothetical protein ONS95_008199 [Cadophora gregata]|uniref:uncharacterized protein n=1 Tax=Cadophora gregata TaxID=51156 RepID=UPI0026DB173A|nr:uncharacterized protein ONS95_008199 [Cadophora gregata]KAK0100235.1 hypothetical protein ONS96_007518 [Cadophora gregata f. sp. sojae]KAK0126611.1 hypothetical protein ONS95_008199 [Cadophora gregata]